MNSTKATKLTNGADHWYHNGIDGMNRRNWEYALECLSQAVRLQPDELEYRKQKHRCSRRKLGKPESLSKVASVKIAAIKSRIQTAKTRSDWLLVDQLAEEGLSINPWEPGMYAALGKAASDAGRLELARYAWSRAVKFDKHNGAYYREFGSVLQAAGEYELAKACFQKLKSIDPTGRIAKELICSVDIAATIAAGGYANASTTRDVRVGGDRECLSDNDVACLAAGESNSLECQNELHLELSTLVSTAEQQIREGLLCSALQTYRDLWELAPHNGTIRKRMEDVELTLLRKEAADAHRQSLANPDCVQSKAVATECCSKLSARELDVFSNRVKIRPNDLLLVFQLADFHRRAGNFELAIPLFQQVVSDINLSDEALVGMGECLVRTGQSVNGQSQLLAALKKIDAQQKPNAFKLAHYWLGRLYESCHQAEAARKHYRIVISADAGFRDVNSRLACLHG